MSLEKKVMDALKTAMRAKDKAAMTALRAIKSEILKVKTSGANVEIDEAGEMKLLQKMVKQRKDSLGIFNDQGREDLAAIEAKEIEVIEQFLPKQMSEAEITDYLKGLIEKTGASSIKDMGRIMGMASKELAGRADGKTISGIVKGLLA